MTVTLHPVDLGAWEADAPARTDLARIYADAPPERLPLPVDDFIHGHLMAGHFFFTARFNERLLAAVAVRDDPGVWWLSHFCVRKTSRRRGVGSRLLALISHAAIVEGRRICAPASQLLLADQLLLSRLGYRLIPAGDYFEFNLTAQGALR